MIESATSALGVWDVAGPIVGIFLGVILKSTILSAKDRQDVSRDKFKDSREIDRELHEALINYTAAIESYTDSNKPKEFEAFNAISVKGEIYFHTMKAAADAILAGRVEHNYRENNLMPRLRECAAKSLPTHYQTLHHLSRNWEEPYPAEFERANYAGIFAVLEKFPEV